MPVSTTVFAVFGHFQNLNLLGLIHDLRAGRTVRQSWFSGALLCPIAHGLPEGAQVEELRVLGQAADLGVGCHFAARHLDADPNAVLRFVQAWDEGSLSSTWLLQQLEELWDERLLDAVTVQELLQRPPRFQENPIHDPGCCEMPLALVPVVPGRCAGPARSEAAV